MWTTQRFVRLNFVELAVRIAVSLGLFADVLRSHDLHIVRRDSVGSKRQMSPNRPHQLFDAFFVNLDAFQAQSVCCVVFQVFCGWSFPFLAIYSRNPSSGGSRGFKSWYSHQLTHTHKTRVCHTLARTLTKRPDPLGGTLEALHPQTKPALH